MPNQDQNMSGTDYGNHQTIHNFSKNSKNSENFHHKNFSKKSLSRKFFLLFFLWLIILGNIFMIPFLYYSSYSIGIPNSTPTSTLSLPLFEMVNSPPLNCDQKRTCCIYLGPIIGKTTTTSTRFLVELSQDISLSITLAKNDQKSDQNEQITNFEDKIITKITQNHNPANTSSTTPARKSSAITTAVPVKANTPTIVEFDHLEPDTVYTVRFNNCHYPLSEQPEGGHGLIKTQPNIWTVERKPEIAVVSCNSINIKNRDDKIRNNLLKPDGFSIQKFLQSSPNLKKKYLNDPKVIQYLAQSTDMWTSLLTRTPQLDYLFLLGDQAYMDSKHDGEENNQFSLSQGIIFEYLTQLWEYKEFSLKNPVLAEEIRRFQLPSDIPPLELIKMVYIKQFSSINDAFTKSPQSYHLVYSLIPLSIRYKIYDLYRNQYIKTYTLPQTRYVLSRVANLFVLDDHDVFDDSNDCPADTQYSLRRLIFDIGLAAYYHYQHSLNLDNNSINFESNINVENHSQQNNPKKTSTTPETPPLPHHSNTPPPYHNVSYLANTHGVGLEVDGLLIQSYSMVYDKYLLAYTPNLPPPLLPEESNQPTDNKSNNQPYDSIYTPVTNGLHHFHIMSDGLCFVFIDTRTARHPGAFNPESYETYTNDPKHLREPYLLLGQQQWADLEEFLYNKAIDKVSGKYLCTTLLVANSMPVLFMQQSPNHLVAIFHDDMLGHWSSLEFEKEQVRLFKLFTNWREKQYIHAESLLKLSQLGYGGGEVVENGQLVKSQLLFLGGDVHSIGYTSIYPYSYEDNSLNEAYVYNRQYQTRHKSGRKKKNKIDQNAEENDEENLIKFLISQQKNNQDFLGNKPLDTLHSLTVSPIQQEGLDAMWLYSLVGFQHSYPLVNDNNDMLLLSNNGIYHTFFSTYSKSILSLEIYLGQILPESVFRIVNHIIAFFHDFIQESVTFILLFWQKTSQFIFPQYHETGARYNKSGFRLEDKVGQHFDKNGRIVDKIDKTIETRLNKSYYYGYNHYSWVNTNGYAILRIYSPHYPSVDVNETQTSVQIKEKIDKNDKKIENHQNILKQVCIESQIYVSARPLLNDQFVNNYLHNVKQFEDKYLARYFVEANLDQNNTNNRLNEIRDETLQLPTLWSSFVKHNTTGFGC
jgi:hypothetical protein